MGILCYVIMLTVLVTMLRRQLNLVIFNMFSSQRDDSQTRGLYLRARKFRPTSSRHTATHRRSCFLLQKQHKVSIGIVGHFCATLLHLHIRKIVLGTRF